MFTSGWQAKVEKPSKQLISPAELAISECEHAECSRPLRQFPYQVVLGIVGQRMRAAHRVARIGVKQLYQCAGMPVIAIVNPVDFDFSMRILSRLAPQAAGWT